MRVYCVTNMIGLSNGLELESEWITAFHIQIQCSILCFTFSKSNKLGKLKARPMLLGLDIRLFLLNLMHTADDIIIHNVHRQHIQIDESIVSWWTSFWYPAFLTKYSSIFSNSVHKVFSPINIAVIYNSAKLAIKAPIEETFAICHNSKELDVLPRSLRTKITAPTLIPYHEHELERFFFCSSSLAKSRNSRLLTQTPAHARPPPIERDRRFVDIFRTALFYLLAPEEMKQQQPAIELQHKSFALPFTCTAFVVPFHSPVERGLLVIMWCFIYSMWMARVWNVNKYIALKVFASRLHIKRRLCTCSYMEWLWLLLSFVNTHSAVRVNRTKEKPQLIFYLQPMPMKSGAHIWAHTCERQIFDTNGT